MMLPDSRVVTVAAACVVNAAAVCFLGASAGELERAEARTSLPPPGPQQRAASTPSGEEREIVKLIAQLDAERFESRNEAACQLAAKGEPAVPYLVDALGAESSELRFRARVLLSCHDRFEDVAPHLVNAIGKRYGPRACAILRQQASRQIDMACQPRYAEQFFRFWGADMEAFRGEALIRLGDAKTRAETARAVQPLLGLCDKTARFSDAASRLDSLSLSCGHQYTPGFVIAETLARGLCENRGAWVAFAEECLQAFEKLASQLRLRNEPTHAVRKEVSERANYSQGAACFLVQILDERSPQRAIVSKRLQVSPDGLRAEFCSGVASTDSRAYERGVGKVHIVDMLTESLSQWPDAPTDGAAQELVAGAMRTAAVGDKPKALAFLDALEACRNLPSHGLNIRAGLGRRLAQRLHIAAAAAPNHRVYYPVRNVHDRIVMLLDMGVSPQHEAFPKKLVEDYLAGDADATSEEQRLALERYVRVLERLRAAGLSLQQPGVQRFTLAMRDRLTGGHDLLAAGVARLDLLLHEHQAPGKTAGPQAVDRALGEWADAATTR